MLCQNCFFHRNLVNETETTVSNCTYHQSFSFPVQSNFECELGELYQREVEEFNQALSSSTPFPTPKRRVFLIGSERNHLHFEVKKDGERIPVSLAYIRHHAQLRNALNVYYIVVTSHYLDKLKKDMIDIRPNDPRFGDIKDSIEKFTAYGLITKTEYQEWCEQINKPLHETS